jgi:hypothetical protein
MRCMLKLYKVKWNLTKTWVKNSMYMSIDIYYIILHWNCMNHSEYVCICLHIYTCISAVVLSQLLQAWPVTVSWSFCKLYYILDSSEAVTEPFLFHMRWQVTSHVVNLVSYGSVNHPVSLVIVAVLFVLRWFHSQSTAYNCYCRSWDLSTVLGFEESKLSRYFAVNLCISWLAVAQYIKILS